MSGHSREPSFASSFVSTSANATHSTISPKKRSPVKIGPWKLGKTLGKGANGRVFLATNVDTNQKAAVKIVSKAALSHDQKGEDADADADDADSAGLSYGIEREIIIMKLLNHKNVLRLYDVWETEKALYLVLEYVEGGELFDLLVDSGPLPEQTAVGFFSQIVLGALYCHSLGICHRDLKPENILLDKDLNVKIADFGMAALESGRLLETSCGSPHYAAPEIVSGLHYHGAESDVWSCGVILFALLTGRLPFDDDNIRDLLLKVQVGNYEIVEDLSPDAIDLIHRMLTVDPEKRIKTKDILKHPFVTRYYNCENDDAFCTLPSPDTAFKPVTSRAEIDKRILEDLVILWHGRSAESIIEKLLAPTSNPEKTFYSLLLRYRHDHANNKTTNSGSVAASRSNITGFNNSVHGNDESHYNNLPNDELVRSSSVISRTTEKIAHSSPASSRSNASRKRLSIAASTAVNRPISFGNSMANSARRNNNTKSRDSLIFSKHTPPVSTTPSPEKLPNNTDSNYAATAASSRRNSTAPSRLMNEVETRRRSLLAVDTTPTKRKSANLIAESSNLQKMLSARPSSNNTRLKRNSVTSKVLSTYARLEEVEKSKKSADDYGKRMSSDFAVLCDVLFGDGSKVDVKIPDSESMATINAIVFGGNASKRSSKRLSSLAPKQLKAKQATGSRVRSMLKDNDTYAQNQTTTRKSRNSSNPVERISQLLNARDIGVFERRAASEFQSSAAAANNSSASKNVMEPPKPISRLDPRYKAYETYQKRSSQHAAYLLELQEEAEAQEEAAREIKAREERLKREQEELERLKSQKLKVNRNPADIQRSAGTVIKKQNHDHALFNPPKRSNLKSNRYSALSMYSTKASSNRLSFYLRELDDEIAKTDNQTKKDRISRLSMLITDPLEENVYEDIYEADDAEDRTSELNFNSHPESRDSMATLKEENEAENNTNETELDVHNDFSGKPRSASVSNVLDDDLCFVDIAPGQNSAVDATLSSSVYDNVPALPAKQDNTFNDDTADDTDVNAKLPKLPAISGIPKEKQIGQQQQSQDTFAVFNHAVEQSKEEFTAPTPAVMEPSDPLVKESEKLKLEPLKVEKQRAALSTQTENQKNLPHGDTSGRRPSFFAKLTQQIQPPREEVTSRKSSFGKTIKSLFSGNTAEPEVAYTVLSPEDAFEALKTLLTGWKHYGIGNLVIDSNRKILKCEILKENTLNVKSCRFNCVVSGSNIGESKITFTHEKGSARSFEKMYDIVKRILITEDILAN